MVLRRGADQRRPADVDLLDCLLEGDVRLQHCGHEWIEVAADQVNLAQTMFRERRHMIRLVASGQDAGVNAWMEGLDPAVHHLGEPGQFADRACVEGGVLQRLQRRAGSEKLIAEALESMPPENSGSSEGWTLMMRPANASRKGLAWIRS